MSGRNAQRGFIFQSIIAMIECIERDDWDEVKLEPYTENDKVDIQLYKRGNILSAIQVKSSENQFERSDVKNWLDKLKEDAKTAKEVKLYLVGDLYSKALLKDFASNPDVRRFPFGTLKEDCKAKLQTYIADMGLNNQVDDDDLLDAYNNFFAEIHNNCISDQKLNREELNNLLKRVLFVPKCLTKIPSINRNVGIIGRDEVMRDLRHMIEQNGHIVLLNGLGGIGKTTVMRWMCNSISEDGINSNHVAWINCGQTLRDDFGSLCDGFGISDDGDAYEKIINKMKRFRGKLYLFLDNLNRDLNEEEMSILNSLTPKIYIMITSRFEIEGIPTVSLGVLDDTSTVDMFYKYYERDHEQSYIDIAKTIVSTVYNHTLLVELLAKAARRSGGTLYDFNCRLKGKGFFDVFKRPIKTKHDEYLTIEDSVIKLYEISSLTEPQQRIMKLFTIFTAEEEIYYKVVDWAKFDPNAMDELVELAWLEQGGLENGYKIHQIIKDSLIRQMKKKGEELKIEEYGEVLKRVKDITSYLSIDIGYRKIQRRRILTEDIARYLEGRTEGSLCLEKISDFDKELLQLCASLYNGVTSVYIDQGEFIKALEYGSKACVINERVLGENHLATANIYNNMAQAYKGMGEYETALKLFDKAIRIRKRMQAIVQPETAIMYNNKADVCRKIGNYTTAMDCYCQALEILDTFGQEQEIIAKIYSGMAVVYSARGEYSDSREYNKKALDIRKQVLGANHPSTAASYNNIGEVCREQGDYDAAISYLKEACGIREEKLGVNHPSTAITYNNLGLAYEGQGNYKEALDYFEKALAVKEDVLGVLNPSTAITYSNIATVYQLNGDLNNALKYSMKALKIRKQVLQADCIDIANSYFNIASVYAARKDYEKAWTYYEKALPVFTVKLGEDDSRTRHIRYQISMIKRYLKQYQ